MPNGPYQGPLEVKVIPPGVSGDDLRKFGVDPVDSRVAAARSYRRSSLRGRLGAARSKAARISKQRGALLRTQRTREGPKR